MDSTFVNQFTLNLSEMAVYAAIAVVMLIGFFKCILPQLRNAGLLNRAVIKLEKSTAKGERPLWRETRFLGRSLRNEWQQFLLNAAQLDLRGMPCDIREYVNEETVVEKPGHSQLAELIPGLLTSLGILGTFMGLMQGLTSVDFTNAEGTIQSIPQLLGGMKFAFATSVAGIACSLLFNMLNRIAYGRAIRALDNFEESFYELAMPRPLQHEVQMLCQKQDEDARMVQMADNIATRTSMALERAVSQAMQPLTQSLDTFIQCATREQVDGIRRVSNQFVQQMNSTLNLQLEELGAVITSVANDQRETQRNLHNTMAAVQKTVQNAEAIAAGTAEIASHVSQLRDVLCHTVTEESKQAEDIRISMDNLMENVESLNAALHRMQLTIDNLTAELNESERSEEIPS